MIFTLLKELKMSLVFCLLWLKKKKKLTAIVAKVKFKKKLKNFIIVGVDSTVLPRYTVQRSIFSVRSCWYFYKIHLKNKPSIIHRSVQCTTQYCAAENQDRMLRLKRKQGPSPSPSPLTNGDLASCRVDRVHALFSCG